MDIDSTFSLLVKFFSKLMLHTNVSIYKIKHFKQSHIPVTVKLLATITTST